MRENRTYGSEGGEARSLPYPYLAAWCAADPGPTRYVDIGPGSAEQREERCTASGTRGKTDNADKQTTLTTRPAQVICPTGGW